LVRANLKDVVQSAPRPRVVARNPWPFHWSLVLAGVVAHRDRLSASNLPRSGEPFPIQAKASAMPLHHGSWRNQNKRRFPSRPEPSQKNPEQVVPYRQSMAGTLGMQGYELQELLKRSARFSSRRSLREPQGADDPAKEVAKRQDHG